MNDAEKTTPQLLTELNALRLQVSQLLAERKELDDALRAAQNELKLRLRERTVELEQANEALRDSEERYRGIVENANDIMATITPNGVVTGVNRSAEIMLGWSKNEMIGQNYRRFVTPASVALIEKRIQQFFLGLKFRSNIEIEVLQKRGGSILFECRTRPIRNREGVPIGFQIVYRDITLRKQQEEKLWKAKEAAETESEEKNEFLATMSHEMRTPLQVLLGYVDLLLNEAYGALDEQQTQIIRKIDRNAHNLLDLITGVLDFNRLEAGRMPVHMTEVDVAELIRDVEEETQGWREFSKVEFFVNVEAGLPRITTDEQKLKVVVKNLLGNALKFTPQGSVTVAACLRHDGVLISVTDTGIGIPVERQALIFEAFQRGDGEKAERSDGFGLGLHIASRFLNLLGGTISVESQVGKGSTFRIFMPLERPTIEE